MALVLREDDVRTLLTMPEAIRVLEGMFRRQAAGDIRNAPGAHVLFPDGSGMTNTLAAYVSGRAGDPTAAGPGYTGVKTFAFAGGTLHFLVLLSSVEDGRLLAIMEGDVLGQMRTGAASGVATRHLARADARVVAVLGTGRQARTQALAMVAVRPVQTLLVYGRTPEQRAAFCAEVTQATGIEARPVADAEEAVRAADIIVTATSAKEPIVRGSWLQPGAHVNAMGSNVPDHREVDTETLTRSALIAVDDLEQVKLEAGDLLIPDHAGEFSLRNAIDRGHLVELGQIVADTVTGRADDESITLFKSTGTGAEDIAVAAYVYQQARERGIGEELNLLP